MALLFCVLAAMGVPSYRVELSSFNFQDDANPDTYFSGIGQLESEGGSLWVMGLEDPVILQLDEQGRLLRRIGQPGAGPAELGKYGPVGMAVTGNRLWVLQDNRSLVHRFENGRHISAFSLKNYQIFLRSFTTNALACSPETLLVQAFPGTGHLALAYDNEGNPSAYVGEIFPKDDAELRQNPALNNTLWCYDGGFWYALFKYRSLVRKFNPSFKKVAEFQLVGEEIDLCEEQARDGAGPRHRIGKNYNLPAAYFTDFKTRGDYLYLMCRSAFFQIDKETGVTQSRTSFFAKGPDFEKTDPTRKLGVAFFAFLSTGEIVFGHPFLYGDTDLLRGALPHIER